MSFKKKMKKIKKIKFTLLLVLLFFFSCTSSSYLKLRVEIPRRAAFNLEQFSEIVITNFFIKKRTKKFDLNQELVNYFASEIEREFKGKTSSKTISLEKEEIFSDKEFWKNLSLDLKGAVLLTGSAQYSEEIRKAISETKKGYSEDLSSKGKIMEERRFYTLSLNLYLIDAKTGEALYERSFKESKGYKNPNQTAPFAFFELIQIVKGKFFRNILGGTKIQERYLISD